MDVSRGAASAKAITLPEAKDWLRVTSTADDTVIDQLCSAAIEQVEQYTSRTLVNRTITLKLDAREIVGGEFIWLPYGPVSSVTSVTVYDADGTGTAVTATDYYLDGDQLVNDNGTWEYGRNWLSVQVVYVAGYGSARSDVPEGLRQSLRVLVADMYGMRQSEVVGTVVGRAGMSWQSYADQYRQGHLSTWA